MKISICNMRITGIDKNYYENQLQEFANKFNSKVIKSVAFGKQDIRGGFSITLFDHRHCVPQQKFFNSKDELLGFVVGCNTFFTRNKKLTRLDLYS